MSRTWKDAPYKVRQKRMMEKGLFDHDHSLHSWGRSDRIFEYEDETVFNKSDAKEIHAFRQKLVNDSADFTEFEEPAVYRLYPYENITPKQIIFKVKRTVVREAGYSSYCTDAEHFDVNTGNDTRDGKIAMCVPFTYYTGVRSECSCPWCSFDDEREAKISRKAKLQNIAKSFNNGASVEELFDYDEFN